MRALTFLALFMASTAFASTNRFPGRADIPRASLGKVTKRQTWKYGFERTNKSFYESGAHGFVKRTTWRGAVIATERFINTNKGKSIDIHESTPHGTGVGAAKRSSTWLVGKTKIEHVTKLTAKGTKSWTRRTDIEGGVLERYDTSEDRAGALPKVSIGFGHSHEYGLPALLRYVAAHGPIVTAFNFQHDIVLTPSDTKETAAMKLGIRL